MASPTPTPTPPHYPITTPHKPHQNQNPPIPTSKSRLHAAAAASNTINIAANHTLTPDFRRSRTTKVISKRNPSSGSSSRHPSSPAAALFLTQFLQPNQSQLPHAHIPALSVPDDYCSILHSLSSPYKTLSFYQSSLPIMRGPKEKGKLLTAAIASLGKSARPDLARRLFDDAVSSGFGDTVFAHSALVSAYARNGLSSEALAVFALMKSRGLKPNVISYNAVIDACVKGPADVPRAIAFFREMLQRRLRPDSKTFNSLLAGCSRTGQLEYARVLFDQMVSMGVPRDIYTYNTFIDVVCKSGNMEVAKRTVADMLADDIRPNVVTFSTLIDGYTKLERFNEALELYTEMSALGVKLDRVGYNALLSLYVKTGRYKEIPWVCEEMEVMGVDKDTVTYNSLIHGYGKLGRLDVVSLLVRDMREKGIPASVLTYSTLIDVYSKAGQHGDAARVFAEFKESGLKADVVMYSSFVDTLAKNGYVESAVWLLDEMVRVGIEPNVVTYNTVIDGFGKSRALVGEEVSEVTGKEITGQLVAEDTGRGLEELFCIQRLFERMIQQGVRPNVVTFSAILNACSRCNSFQDTSLLLEKLRLFDNFTYGVAHGMLMGCPEVWTQARSLFDELRRMDPSTSSAFYNALTDMLWHFGQKRGAQRVVVEGVERQVWENAWSEFSLDLHLMSSGAAQAMVHAWLLNVHSIVFQGRELPAFLSILTGWGKHSKVAGASIIRHVIEALLKSIGAPFQIERFNIGRLVSPGAVIAAWMRESGTVNILLLRDMRNQLANPSSLLPQLQALQL